MDVQTYDDLCDEIATMLPGTDFGPGGIGVLRWTDATRGEIVIVIDLDREARIGVYADDDAWANGDALFWYEHDDTEHVLHALDEITEGRF